MWLLTSLLSPPWLHAQDFDSFQYRNIGPSRGGRVTAVAGTVAAPSTFYLGASGGGIWKTEDYGTTWKVMSDGYFETPSIGDIAVAQNDANIYGHNPKDLRYRFQRVSPVHVSPHDANVVYHASQFAYRTMDDGKTWETISPDLTAFEADKQVISGSPITRDITGEEIYSTIYSLRESPVQAGVIWSGSNDGLVYVKMA